MENNFNKFAPQGRTKLVSGTVMQPELSGLRLVVVPCSETGKPDTILHDIISKKWSIVARDLKGWFSHHLDFKLGNIHSTAVQSDTWVVHFLCHTKDGQVNGLALQACLKKLSALAVSEKASVHFAAPTLELIPSLGELVGPYLLNKGIHTYFYDEPLMAAALKVSEAILEESRVKVEEMVAEESLSRKVMVTEPIVEKTSAKPKKKVSKKPARKSVAKKASLKPISTVSDTSSIVDVSNDIRGHMKEVVIIDESASFGDKDASFLDDLSKLDE